ncbi:MAG: amidohydrolase [Phenylobacterium sp.]|jgi:predicted amidohydrolase YtcJ|uniref:amidohydrolase n=1 Tax=Phenylobacterium sp. TaxID=1871053 RepID=UPI001B619C49|nr:amidohydrolase [Phenylobacterium sp.]MBP7818038.1 amidohydrolase [Phenylobacterium sp.]MBP9230063.1 amidohydrolase [Phenylobacterium sp.]MBP9753627.1 amidohydrolase [Phenylobacterium sp.]
MRLKFACLAVAWGLAVCGPAQAADLLIFGGPIYTGVDAQPKVEALLVKDGRVAFTGSLAEARKQAGRAQSIDLKGAAAYPGFVDAHAHLMGIGLREMTLNLEGTLSIAEMTGKVKAWSAAHPGSHVLSGRGWIETHYPEKRFPNRADLDAVVSDRPVVLGRADGHAIVVNSKMLALAGITRDTPDPAGGQILRDAAGEPTGMLVDNAKALVTSKVPPTSEAQMREAAQRAVDLYASRGWTGMHSVSVAAKDVAILGDMAAAGTLPIRVDNFMDLASQGTLLTTGPSADPTGLVRVDGIKMYMDGALGSRGAALLAPYEDAPGTGLLLTPADLIAKTLLAARKSKAQIAIHAIGDRGNRLVLDAFETAFDGDPAQLRAARWRIEHAQVISPTDLPRFADLGVIASMQPSHAIGDLYFAPARLGEARLKGAYAWADLWASGAHMATGTDAPVEKGDPLVEFYAATYRHDLKGFAGSNWGLDEVLTRPQALAMITKGAAYAVFREKDLGDLAVGKAADISVFSVDLMTAPFPDIAKAHAVMTVVAGKVVYRAR